MRIMPRIVSIIAFALLAAAAVRGAEPGQTHVRALLVLAGNTGGGSDSRLAAYEPTLRRILRFTSYRLAGEGATTIAPGGQGTLSLGRGHSIQVESDKGDARGIRLRIRWQDGSRTLMSTGLSLRPNVPAVLGGPSTGNEGEVWAVIIVAE